MSTEIKQELTEIVELPAFIKDGKIIPFDPETSKFPETLLRNMAGLHGSELIYYKVRATYTVLEVLLCARKDCYNPIEKGTNICRTHGGSKS